MSFRNQQIPLRVVLNTHHGADLPTIALTSSQQIALGQQLIGFAAEQAAPVLVVTGFACRPPWGAADRLSAGAGPQWIHLHHPEWAQDSWLLLLTGPASSLLLLGADRTGEAAANVLLSFDPELVGVALGWLAQHDADHAMQLRAAQQGAATSRLDPQLVGQVTAAIARLSSAPPAPAWDGEAEQRWRDALLSGLVHDMRTPLNAVSAALELLDVDLVRFELGERRELIGAALRNVAHLNELIRLMLDTGRLAEGQFTLSWQALQPHIWLAEALSMLRPLLVEQKLFLEIQCHPAIKVLWGDRVLLVRVIQNLVGNAIRFTPAGGRIAVRIEPGETADTITLRVSDTGSGIAADELPYIFHRYFHGQTPQRGGHGLGLYFCKLVAEAHAGTIHAESAVGAGTTVTLTLPASPVLVEGRNGEVL